MAVEKLKLSEDLAWTYFEFFDALQESNHYERQIKADQRRSQTFRLVLEYDCDYDRLNLKFEKNFELFQ